MGSRSGTEFCGQKMQKSQKKDNLKCCFLITVDSKGQIDISPQKYPDSEKTSIEVKTLQERIRCGNLFKGVPKKSRLQARKHNLSFSLLKSEQKRLNSLANRKTERGKIDTLQGPLAGMSKSDILRELVKICRKDLFNSPSIMEHKVASAGNQERQNLDPARPPHLQVPLDQKEPHIEKGFSSRETLPEKDSSSMAKNVPSLQKLSEKTAAQVRRRLQKMSSMVYNPRYEGGYNTETAPAQYHQHQQQQHSINGNNQPHVTISFIPVDQREAAPATPVMCPCQQFLGASPNNLPSCCSCTCSNCCPSRPPPYRPMAPADSKCNECGFFGPPIQPQDASCPCSSCSVLRPALFYSSSCNSCPFYSAPNPQSSQSLGFMSSGNHFGQQMCPPIETPTPYPGFTQPQQQSLPGGGYYPGMNYCLHPSMQPNYNQCTHCRMHLHHHPYCHCGSCYNGQKQYQQQPPIPLPPKKPRLLKTQDEADMAFGIKSIFTKTPQDSEVNRSAEFNSKKLSKEMGRESGGGTNNKSDPNSLYAARFGRACLILRPTATAMIPRLLTKRISRYTSVMAWPTSTPK